MNWYTFPLSKWQNLWNNRKPYFIWHGRRLTTVTLSNGLLIETVSKLLEHAEIATIPIYAWAVEQKVIEDMKKS